MIEKTMEVDRMEDVISVFGSFDQNLRMIETEYNVRVTDRDEQIHITGEAENVLYAEKAITGLLSLAAKGEEIGEQNVRYIFRLVREGTAAGSLRKAGAFCSGARSVRRAGTPVGTRGATEHQSAAAAGCPDHGALPPGPDAPPCHGCCIGLYGRHSAGPAAGAAPAGSTEGRPAAAGAGVPSGVSLVGKAGPDRPRRCPDGGGTGSGQRLWGPVPGKPGPDGRNISSKKYLFDELTKNSGKKSAIPLL